MHDHYDIYIKQVEHDGQMYCRLTIKHEELDCIDLLLTHAEAVVVAKEMVEIISSLDKDISPTS